MSGEQLEAFPDKVTEGGSIFVQIPAGESLVCTVKKGEKAFLLELIVTLLDGEMMRKKLFYVHAGSV